MRILFSGPNVSYNKAEFMEKAAQELYELSAKQWYKENEPDGDSWTKRISGGSHPILNLSGALLASIEMVPEANAILITGDKIAVYHQFGTSKMTARPLIQLPEEYEQKLAESFEDSIHIN